LKRILLVSSEFPPGPGGIGRHAADLSLALAGQNCIVDVFSNLDYSSKGAIDNFRNELPENVRVNHFKRVGLLTYLLRISKVLKAIRKNHYEHLIFTGKFPLWIGGIVKTLYGRRKKIDMFVHGSEINPERRLIKTITHWALGKADIIWAVSEFTKSILPEKVKHNEEIRILANGVHPSLWPSPVSIEPFSDWKGHPKLLTVGSISPRKGQHRVINSLTELIRKFPEIHYHIVGMDSNAADLRGKVNSLNLNGHVTFHGRLPGKNELAKAYRTSDIFIMLSQNQPDGDVEGFGISILEANLYGVPAIGARGCGIENAIESGTNGELVDGNNPDEIASAITKILGQKDQYSHWIEEWVSRHDWNILINEFLNTE